MNIPAFSLNSPSMSLRICLQSDTENLSSKLKE